MNKAMTFILLYFIQAGSAYAGAENWNVVLAEDPLTDTMACLMESSVQTMQDGQANTPVKIIYNGNAFIVTTKSNVDLTYESIGLVVDEKHSFAIDRLLKKTNVIFDARSDEIRQAFIHGLQAEVALGFWPSWPKTQSFTAGFDLIGFTRSYEKFERCKQSGELN